MAKQISSFVAHEASGKEHRIRVIQPRASTSTSDDPDATIPGFPKLLTTDGMNVIKVGDRQYEIVQRGIRLTSTDPKAF